MTANRPGLLVLGLLVLIGPARGGEPTDLVGDPLPRGAVARVGTLRWHHGAGVTAVAFRDNRTLVSRGDDGKIRLWDVPSGKQIREHGGAHCETMGLSADGKTIARVNWEAGQYELQLVETATGRVLRGFGKDGRPAVSSDWGAALVLSPDGNLLVHSDTYQIVLWELDAERPRHVYKPAEWLRGSVALSADGKLLAAGCPSGNVLLWDTATGREAGRLRGHKGEVWAVAFHPRRPDTLASAGWDGVIRFWDLGTASETDRIVREKASHHALAFSPDGATLAVQATPSYPYQPFSGLFLLDLATKKEVRRFVGSDYSNHGYPGCIAFSPNGRYLASGHLGSAAGVWEVVTGKPLLDPAHAGARPEWVVISPDGRLVATGEWDTASVLWDTATGKGVIRLGGPHGGYPLGFTADSKRLIAADGPGGGITIRWWDVRSGKEVRKSPGKYYSPGYVTLAPDRRTLLLAHQGCHLLDIETGKKLCRVEHDEWWGPLEFSPDSKLLVDWTGVWETATGKKLQTIRKVPAARDGKNDIKQMAFRPDGKIVAFITPLKVFLHEPGKADPVRVLELDPHRWSGASVAFSPDGKLLATGERGVVRLWEAATGGAICRREGHRGEVTAVVFTPDGRRLISASRDRTLLVWDVAALVKDAK
jgi:WD40 repeat protein